MSDRTIEIRPDKNELAAAVAEALEQAVDAALQRGRNAHIALTGGSMGEALMKAWVARADDERDWTRVHIWWGDERFVPAGDDDRNDKQADDAGLKKLGVPATNVHRMPSSDDGDVAAGAEAYAQELAEFTDVTAVGLPEKPQMPTFDVLMLGVGPDGHVASLFPGHRDQLVDRVTVVAVQDAPKPPPTRLSLTFPALAEAREVWLMVAGEDKADAVATAFSSSDPMECPASVVGGQVSTTWWLDTAAASKVEHS